MKRKTLLTVAMVGMLAVGSVAYGQLSGRFGRRLAGATADGSAAGRGRAMAFAAGYLGLDEAQRQELLMIAGSTAAKTEADRALLREGRQALSEAAKSGVSESQLRLMAEQQSVVLGRLIGDVAVAGSEMYTVLTPEQQEKAGELQELIQERIGLLLAGN